MNKEDTRLLIVAPTGRDAALMRDVLRRFDIAAEPCPTVRDACEKASYGVGAMVLAEEALDPDAIEQIARFFRGQPKWSTIPLILLTSNGDRIYAGGHALLEQSGIRGNLILLERPVRRLTLRIAVEAAIHTRNRQYELRDYMQELVRQQERLRQSQKMESIGILAGGVAHDFNNILTGVLGNTSLALEALPAGSPNRVLLQQVVQSSERAAHLTRQLLAYAGKGRFIIESLDLSQQVREISALIQTSIPSAVQLRFDLADRLPSIDADASQVQQIIMNLVINGAEAIPVGQSGTVTITTGVHEVDEAYLRTTLLDSPIPEGTYVMLEVHDTGIGMDQETQSRIFDPFFTTKFTGRGLGLAAVMGIVRGHHGTLKIYSTPGRGSTFKVLLPASKSSVQEAKPQSDATLPASSGTVMVIDDESVVRQVAKTTLERFGYSVIVCEDGPTAIRRFRTMAAEISAVLLDMSMPAMSGEETFRHLRTIRPDVKVILSSGYNEVEVMSRFAGKGLAGFIQKPYTAARLGEMVRSVLLQADKLERPTRPS
jgi:signal transduction histidine kinase/CheY-like chemotaxis protein